MPTESTEPQTETALTLKHAMLAETFKKTEATRFLELIDEEVMKEVCDPTTTKGREREKSLSGGISSFKAHMNRLAETSIEEHVLIVKNTRSYLKEFNANCDERRDARKAPSLKHEADEKERKAGHRATIGNIRSWGVDLHDVTLEGLSRHLTKIERIDISEMREFGVEAELAKTESIERVKAALEAATKREAQAAELKRLQEEAEKRKVEDAKRLAEEERLKAEAEAKKEAEKAEAEAKKQRLIEEDKGLQEIRDIVHVNENQSLSDIMESLEELENFDMTYFVERDEKAEELRSTGIYMLNRLLETAKHAAIEENKAIEAARIEQERLDGIKAKEEAEAAQKRAEEAEKQRQIDEDKRIEQAKADATKAAEDRLKKIQDDLEAIAKENADRVEADRLAKENEDLKRKADKKHRAKVRGEAYCAIEEYISNEDAETIIDLIINGDIPHVTINF